MPLLLAVAAAGAPLGGVAQPVSAGTVQLRNQPAALAGEVVEASAAGVLVRTGGDDAGRLVSWDRVRSVEGAAAARAEEFRLYGDGLMRARTRLERGDWWLADQAIDPLYRAAVADAETGFSGPSGLLLAECAMRSALARNATAGATLAWLHWSAADRLRPRAGAGSGPPAAQWVGGATSLPRITDDATGLCPTLPPIFPHSGAGSAGTLGLLSQSPEIARLAGEGSRVRALAAAYLLAARIAAGETGDGEQVALPAPTGDAEQLVLDVVAAQTAPSEPMRAARQRLMRRLEQVQRDADTRETNDDAPTVDRTWQRAWIHAAVGRSLLAEEQPAQRRLGMIELLHVPALDGGTQPGLAVTALCDVIEQLRRDGGSEGAIAALSAELKSRFGAEPPLAPRAPVGDPAAPPVPQPTNQEPEPPLKESP